MAFITLTEINTNPIYQPPKEWLVNYKISKMIEDFFKNPILLKSKSKISHSIKFSGKVILNEEEYIKINESGYYEKHKEHYHLFYDMLKKLNPKEQENILNEIEEETTENKTTKTTSKCFIIIYKKKIVNSDIIRYVCEFNAKITVTFKKYSLIEELLKNREFKYGFSNFCYESYIKQGGLNKYINSFNIIEKDFKLMSENKRDTYKRYFHSKPFECFEETGIEFLYARSGYSIDGKRLPNFNRGAVWNLKNALKMNKIPLKGLTKKDDIIKALMKI
tara:strand:- start:4320 stop:5150 length:831 start_codon:yes stop_codon:yes gene_type:complete